MTPARKLAARYEVRLAVRRMLLEGDPSSARRGEGTARTARRPSPLSEEEWIALGEALWLPASPQVRTALSFSGLARKLAQLKQVFSKMPRLWDDFKKIVGIESPLQLPSALKEIAKQGYGVLKKILGRAFSEFPLNIFLIRGAGVNDFLKALVRRSPALEKALAGIKERADVIGDWLKKRAPVLSTILIVAVFVFIWMNVLEFEWNLADLARALVGQISLGDLLASLPGSALGFLLNSLGISTFGLLPAALAARILWLIARGYVTWDGKKLGLNEAALRRDGYEILSF
jgi:hypothetical protein